MYAHKLLFTLSLFMLCLLSSSISARAAIFTENFNSYAGNQNANQSVTGLPVAFGGSVTGWTGAGANALHAVQLNGTPNWAIMFYGDNTITSDPISGANDFGTNYELDFDYGTGEYAPCCQTEAGDGLVVEVQRVSDNFVLASQQYLNPVGFAASQNFDGGLQGTLSYVGDGGGDVKIFVRTANNLPRFEGSLDNLSLDTAAVPEPSSFALAALGLGSVFVFLRRGRTRRSA